MSPSSSDSADDLTLALTKTLRAAFDAFPLLVARRGAAGQPDWHRDSPARSVRPPGRRGRRAPIWPAPSTTRSRVSGPRPGAGVASVEERVMLALNRHASSRGARRDAGIAGVAHRAHGGRARLGGERAGAVGRPGARRMAECVCRRRATCCRTRGPTGGSARTLSTPQTSERRAIADRRAVGERRLYDRRPGAERMAVRLAMVVIPCLALTLVVASASAQARSIRSTTSRASSRPPCRNSSITRSCESRCTQPGRLDAPLRG